MDSTLYSAVELVVPKACVGISTLKRLMCNHWLEVCEIYAVTTADNIYL